LPCPQPVVCFLSSPGLLASASGTLAVCFLPPPGLVVVRFWPSAGTWFPC
jgi:hypothetical protein